MPGGNPREKRGLPLVGRAVGIQKSGDALSHSVRFRGRRGRRFLTTGTFRRLSAIFRIANIAQFALWQGIQRGRPALR